MAATAASVALGAIPFSIWFERQAKAQAALTRYNIQTPAGAAMLAQYASAVKILMTSAGTDPRSWTFWWYMHWVKGSTTKDAELARIYPDPLDPRRALALETWNTCQPHGTGMDRMVFLPWHRMFVYFYERLLRSVLNNPTFTLPYGTIRRTRLSPINVRSRRSSVCVPIRSMAHCIEPRTRRESTTGIPLI